MLKLKQWKINKLKKKLISLRQYRINNPAKAEMVKKELQLYNKLIKIYHKLIGNKHFPYAEVEMREAYRAAASLDDPAANYQFGLILLEEARFRLSLQKQGILDSQMNLNYAQRLFDEAHAYLKVADDLGHTEALRLRGLALINGWGLAQDREKGFEMIVESIDKEGSWDRVPQIFAAIGLNKPEFFAAIMQRRKG